MHGSCQTVAVIGLAHIAGDVTMRGDGGRLEEGI